MAEDQNKPNYYSITPASVRYDKKLKPNAKLLYGEITALCNDKGYCWAKNSYFAGLYEVDDRSVSRWVSDLEKNGYIKTKLIYKTNSKEIDKRLIFISDPLIIKNLAGGDKNVTTPPDTEVTPSGDKNVPTPPDNSVKQGGDKNVLDNNTTFKDNSIVSFNSLEDTKKYFSDNNFKSDPKLFWLKKGEIAKLKDRKREADLWEYNHEKMFPEKYKTNQNDYIPQKEDFEIKKIRADLRFYCCQIDSLATQHLNFEDIIKTETGFKITALHPVKALNYKKVLDRLNIQLELNNYE